MEKCKCKKCGNEIEQNKYWKNRNKMFCSTLCQTRFNSLANYQKHKDNIDFKAKRKIYFDEWRTKNREHFNSLSLIASKKYQKKITAERKAKGLCLKCGNSRDSAFLRCEKCRAQLMAWYNNAHHKTSVIQAQTLNTNSTQSNHIPNSCVVA